MIYDFSLPSTKRRSMPVLLSAPVERLQGPRQTRPDLISQYAAQRKAYAVKSKMTCGGIDVKVDTARCYWPGQPVETLISIPKSALQSCSELSFELKGLVNTHTFRSTAQSTNVQVWSETLFQHTVSITLGDDGLPVNTVKNHPTTLVDQMASSEDAQGAIEWACTFGLPERGQIVIDGSKDGPRKLIPLPPTFRDDAAGIGPGAGGVSTYVAYLVKITGIVKSKMRQNLRAWIPILVLPYAIAPPILSMSIPPAYGSDSAIQLATPEGWVRCLMETRLKRMFVFGHGTLEVEVALPRPIHIPFGVRVPFIMRIRAYASSKAALDDKSAGGLPLPELPLTGAGEKHPVFLIRRLEHCSTIGRPDLSRPFAPSVGAATRARHTNAPCDVEWGTGHIPGRSEGIISAAAAEGDWSALLSLGHSWTDAHFVDDPSNADTNPKGKGKATGRWLRDACVSGTLLPWIPPSILLPKLHVTYSLGLAWTIKGVGNGVKTELIQWHASSGMSPSLVEKLSVEEISKRIAGDKYELLTGQSELDDDDGDADAVGDDADEVEVDCAPPEYEHPAETLEAPPTASLAKA